MTWGLVTMAVTALVGLQEGGGFWRRVMGWAEECGTDGGAGSATVVGANKRESRRRGGRVLCLSAAPARHPLALCLNAATATTDREAASSRISYA